MTVWKKRRDMKPGEIFAAERTAGWWGPRCAWVVIDAKTEVNFWTGDRAHFGDVAPDAHVEVL